MQPEIFCSFLIIPSIIFYFVKKIHKFDFPYQCKRLLYFTNTYLHCASCFSFNENKIYVKQNIVLELCALKTSKCKAVYSRTIQI